MWGSPLEKEDMKEKVQHRTKYQRPALEVNRPPTPPCCLHREDVGQPMQPLCVSVVEFLPLSFGSPDWRHERCHKECAFAFAPSSALAAARLSARLLVFSPSPSCSPLRSLQRPDIMHFLDVGKLEAAQPCQRHVRFFFSGEMR